MTRFYRRSSIAYVKLRGRLIELVNPLNGNPITLNAHEELIWRSCDNWASLHDLLKLSGERETLSGITALINAEVLLEYGSLEHCREEEFLNHFPWGEALAYYQFFQVRRANYLKPDAVRQEMLKKVSTSTPPGLTLNHTENQNPQFLPESTSIGQLDGLISQRRSRRAFSKSPLSIEAVSQILNAGFRIRGLTSSGINGDSPIPLSVAPSAGGRNPHEAYIALWNVANSERCMFHYSATQHSLVKIAPLDNINPSDLLTGQEWFDGASFTVFFIALTKRTAWKYGHPTAFRTILIEAGHRAQNMLLKAEELHINCTPTCAISEDSVLELVQKKGHEAIPTYSISFGAPSLKKSVADISSVIPIEISNFTYA